MKKFVIFIAAVLLITSGADAKIRRVGFFGSPISGTDYITFATAYTAAVSGDTILMFPNTQVAGSIGKKLMIIGPGNWLDPNSTPKGNANLQAFAGIATCGDIYFVGGSDGSVLSGFYGGSIYVADSNITIKRNREIDVYVTFLSPAGTINNLQVLQNYRVSINTYYTNASSSLNMNISNNLMKHFSTPVGNTYSGTIANNVWAYDLTWPDNGGAFTLSSTNGIELGAGAYLLQNNIFVSHNSNAPEMNYNYFPFTNGGSSIFNYNMAIQAATGPAQTWGTGTGNTITLLSNADKIFIAFPYIGTESADARYQLMAGSPALTAGAGGTPIGMFAGSYPYKLSTIPTIPTIYTLTSPQGNNPPGSTIQINVSTRGNN